MNELACRDVGRHAPRQCTDKLCYFLFTGMNVLLFALLITVSAKGDLNKITHGTDYNGNVCGKGYPDGLTITSEEWSARTLLWYPFSWDQNAKEFRIKSALQYGICVSECNPASGVVTTYGGVNNSQNAHQTFSVLFSSEPTFHRCVPNFKTFNCGVNNCSADADESNGDATSAMGFGDFFFGLLQQIYSSLWITFLFFFFAVALCFIWIIILRRAVKPVVSAVIVLVFFVGVGVVSALIVHYKKLHKDPATKGSDEASFALAIAIIAAIFLFLYVCVMLFLRKSIMISCDIIEEGSRIIVDIPSIMIVPLYTSLVVFLNLFMFASIAALLYTVGTSQMTTAQVENSLGQMVIVMTHHYKRELWVDYAQFFNFFMMLWVLAFQNGVAYMSISLVGSTWFFSMPGEAKDTTSEKWPVLKSYGMILKYHVGTVAFGTLLFTILAFLRLCLRAVEKYLQKLTNGGSDKACCLLLCCAECCLSCLERIVRYFTEHGFVMTAMTGASMIPAAREGISLLTSTPAVMSINFISDVILAVSRWLIVLIVTFSGIAALRSHSGSNATVVACAVVLAVGTWFIAGVFTRVLTVCIDTTLLCFCYDMKHHNGADRPYYSADDLKEHITVASNKDPSRRKEYDKLVA